MLSKRYFISFACLFLITGFKITGQVSAPDSVCVGQTRIYHVDPNPGSNYIWLIDGKTEASFTTNELACTWKKSGVHVVEVIEHTFPGCLGPSRSVMIVVSQPELIIDMPRSNDGVYNLNCFGNNDGYISVMSLNNAGNVSYLWKDGTTGDFRNNLAAGTYDLIATNADGCLADTAVNLTQPDPLRIVPAIRNPRCKDIPDGGITLDISGGSIAGIYSFLWSDKSTGSVLSNVRAGIYYVTVTDINGCSVTDTIGLASQNIFCLLIPDAFSPNGDGVNDTWEINNINFYPQVEITVYNRWGQVVWVSARGYPVPWDGRNNEGHELPTESYHYALDIHDGSGISIGTVTIVK